MLDPFMTGLVVGFMNRQNNVDKIMPNVEFQFCLEFIETR